MTHMRGHRRERGASTLEFVLTTPLLLLFILFMFQFGFIAHSQNIARAAADEGAARARAFDGSAAEGQSKAEDYVSKLNHEILGNASVRATRTAETASVTVSGNVISLVPGWHPKISQSSTGPVERFVEEAP
jgi:Flp pilus assembly protein TadG